MLDNDQFEHIFSDFLFEYATVVYGTCACTRPLVLRPSQNASHPCIYILVFVVQGAAGCWSIRQHLDKQPVDMPVLNMMWNHPHGGRHMYKQVAMPYEGFPCTDCAPVVVQQLGQFAQEIVESMQPSWPAASEGGVAPTPQYPNGTYQ